MGAPPGPPMERPDTAFMAPPTGLAVSIDPAIIHEVFLWITVGATDFQITEEIKRRWPEEDPKRVMALSFLRIVETGNMAPNLIRGWCIEAAREIYREAVRTGDIDSALRAVALVARMGGK